jgi:hypothetical protein
MPAIIVGTEHAPDTLEPKVASTRGLPVELHIPARSARPQRLTCCAMPIALRCEIAGGRPTAAADPGEPAGRHGLEIGGGSSPSELLPSLHSVRCICSSIVDREAST